MFDSKAERDRAEQLKVMENDGDIQDLELQPQTSLSDAEIKYKPDFPTLKTGFASMKMLRAWKLRALGLRQGSGKNMGMAHYE